jgi:hypothetical protein
VPLSVLIELGPVSLNLVDPGAADQIGVIEQRVWHLGIEFGVVLDRLLGACSGGRVDPGFAVAGIGVGSFLV